MGGTCLDILDQTEVQKSSGEDFLLLVYTSASHYNLHILWHRRRGMDASSRGIGSRRLHEVKT
jgi:hypothetical protein